MQAIGGIAALQQATGNAPYLGFGNPPVTAFLGGGGNYDYYDDNSFVGATNNAGRFGRYGNPYRRRQQSILPPAVPTFNGPSQPIGGNSGGFYTGKGNPLIG